MEFQGEWSKGCRWVEEVKVNERAYLSMGFRGNDNKVDMLQCKFEHLLDLHKQDEVNAGIKTSQFIVIWQTTRLS